MKRRRGCELGACAANRRNPIEIRNISTIRSTRAKFAALRRVIIPAHGVGCSAVITLRLIHGAFFGSIPVF